MIFSPISTPNQPHIDLLGTLQCLSIDSFSSFKCWNFASVLWAFEELNNSEQRKQLPNFCILDGCVVLVESC